MIMAPEQCRAARAWLNWSQGELAEKASVGLSTVKSFEGGLRTPIANNLTAMQRALETGGIEMVFGKDGNPAGIAWTGSAKRSI
jgi:ribosome-binding protein aMBF1 (putative translation factor)